MWLNPHQPFFFVTKSPSTISISNIFKFRHFNPPYLLLRFQNIVVLIPVNYLQSAKSCIRIFRKISPSNITKHLHFPAFFRKILPWNIRNMPIFSIKNHQHAIFPVNFPTFLVQKMGWCQAKEVADQAIKQASGLHDRQAPQKWLEVQVWKLEEATLYDLVIVIIHKIWWFWWFCNTKMMSSTSLMMRL